MSLSRVVSFMGKRHYLAVLLMMVSSIVNAESDSYRFDHPSVLGTSMRVSVNATSLQARAINQSIFEEVQRLDAIFSGYRSDSEISVVNQTDAEFEPSPDLVALIALCEHWRETLSKGFSCRMGRVVAQWRQYVDNQQSPKRRVIRDLAKAAALSRYDIADFKKGKPATDFDWQLGGIAKGFILDKALAKAKQLGGASFISIDIGGDSVLWQSQRDKDYSIGLASPVAMDDSAEISIGHLRIKGGAVAYSGHGSRTYDIAGRQYSHILTPRDGWPPIYPFTSIVYAPTAVEADALATSFAVMEAADVLAYLANRDDVAAMLITNEGRQIYSSNWFDYFEPAMTSARPVATIQFGLPKLKVTNLRRPYVALWIQDAERKVIKHLLVLGDHDVWMRENRLWWRQAGRKEDSLLAGFARPTRRAGVYDLTWNGLDDYGQPLAKGRYTLVMEVSREHGGHEVVKIDFDSSARFENMKKTGNKEIEFLQLALRDPHITYTHKE